MTLEGEQTRARLLTAARDLYLEQGFARFALREVARRSQVTAAAVYRHFDSKEALLREVCGEGFRIFSSYLLRALAAATAEARLERCIEQYLAFGLEHPRDYRVIFMNAAEDLPLPPLEPAELAPTFQFLVDRVRECMAEKLLAKAAPEETALTIWSHVHGLVSLRLAGHFGRLGSDAAFKRFYVKSTGQLLAGLRGR